MVDLKRYELNFDKTFAYVKDNLNETNTLSTELINLVNWKSGRFFAFLPKDIKIEHIHAFEYGKVTTNKDRVKTFIFRELKQDGQLICIFDDFSDEYRSDYNTPLFQTSGLFYKKEVYFLVDQKNASLELMQDCFWISSAIWHSLCILSKTDLSYKKDKELTLLEIKNVCLNATLIVIGAYDADGYIMWESSEKKHSSITELNDDEIQD